MRIGVLTGGGDCPGLNAVIRAVVRTCDARYGSSVVGFLDGWRGLLEDRRIQLHNDDRNDRLLAKGGTMLGTARTNPEKLRAGLADIKQTLEDNGIDVLIPIGGEGTLTAAHWLSEEGVPVVGVPKTIDNDIDCTDVTFGHDTALQIATEAIDRLHSTAESHQRVMLVEVMGRHAGWIALHAGIAGGADVEDVIANGEVLTALNDYRLSIFGTNMYLLYLPNRHQTRAVRTCIDFLMDKARSVEN